MKLLGKIQHVPTAQKYSAGKLTSTVDKNKAYALLYRKYIGESRDPWKIPVNNTSGLRVEERIIEGTSQKVIVDDFEDRAIVGGIKCDTTGEILGTARILRRQDQDNGMLEIERYDSFPEDLRRAIVNCDVEGNRMAIDRNLTKKRCILLLYSALIKDVQASNMVYSVPPGFVKKVPFSDRFVLGSFRYDPSDAYAASIGVNSSWTVPLLAQLYAASAGSFYTPEKHTSGTAKQDVKVGENTVL